MNTAITSAPLQTCSWKGRACMSAFVLVMQAALSGCHGHLKHVDGPGHSEDAPGQQKKHH